MTNTQSMPTEDAVTFAAYEAIAATLQQYVGGARAGDAGLLASAFLENATVRGSYGGQPTDWTLREFCAVVASGGPAPNLKVRIASIEYTGTAAMARLEAEDWRGTRYTDFFILVSRDNTWKISGKVFFAHSRA
jgi:hypothetical protein